METKKHRNIGAELIKLRGGLRYSQEELAIACEVSARTLLRWENGYRLPTIAQQAKLLRALVELDPEGAAHIAATLGTSLEAHGLSGPSAAAPALSTAQAVDLALYVVADELEVRAVRARPAIASFLGRLAALGLTCEQAAAMVSPPRGKPARETK